MIWLKVKEVAELEQVTTRMIRTNIKNGKYKDVRLINGIGGKNGEQYEISLDSLKENEQSIYIGKIPESSYKDILHYTGEQRKKADFKALIVSQYKQSRLSIDEFITKFNEDNPEDQINKHKLMRWQNKYKKSGDVADLIDKRGGHNKGKSSILPEVWDYFYNLYMTQQKPSIQRCWEFTQRQYTQIPSVSAFERKVKEIPEYVILQYRSGEKALNDKLPSMIRSRLDIKSNSIWFSDHHLLDVIVLDEQGKPVRLWLTTFFDARSNKIVSYIVRSSEPNATVVKRCLRKGIERNQVIPNECYFDNGKDYRSKSFSENYPMSLVKQLGIKMIYATPYHGQAKTVERFFGTLEDRFGKLFDTYIGRNPQERPEQMRISNKEVVKKSLPMQKFIELLDVYIEEYNNTPSRGMDMNGKTPNQVYLENLESQTRIIDSDTLKLLCGTFEERTVQTNGIQYLNNFYWNEALIPYFRKKVIVSYDSEDLNSVYVFDMNYRAICLAQAKAVTMFRNTTEEDYRRAQKEKKAVKAHNKKYAPSREFSTQQIIAKNQFQEKQYEESIIKNDIKSTESIQPKVFKDTELLIKKETQPKKRIRRENSISEALLEDYEANKTTEDRRLKYV